ncbi:E3 ubiquitin-protein ligase At1g63170-like [Gastrolobium bilobum]|uniref:E3 ubiquitin-protein ligase At1g63170-like n=1 Tax=Gastrolobium bilobum TaxID=150636 RepID=UPI002AB094FC|nr:E3 ubiquitin-protein ligase At1g63170-like [Gastrolobium bilobum]XP_061359553.1 E3 ubiquitin-protein ligase At1g63170-like [Gastrolobium bilobum]
MDVSNPERNSNTQTDQYPLLMEQLETHNVHQHIIDITRNTEALSSSSHNDQHPEIHLPQNEDQLTGSTVVPTHQISSFSASRYNSRNSSSTRRGEGYGHRRRSPLNSGLWISVELLVTLSQIIASIVVLSLSRNENPQAPLFAWIVGYASGCVATLPILYWRYRNHNQSTEQDTSQPSQGSSGSDPAEPTSYTAISVAHVTDEDNSQATESAMRSARIPGAFSSRFNGLVDHFKMALDCFFAVWFVVGNVWIFGGHTSPSDAPKLYRLCIVFLTFSCIGYAMPFILCATICCCLPCIISVLGIREDFSQNRGASVESINALPIYKFRLKENENGGVQDVNTAVDEGGVLAAGTEKERVISGEDAVCCICLAKYVDDDELRELPCFHVFHVECIDKWLKINASCPLCKNEVGTSGGVSPSATGSTQP